MRKATLRPECTRVHAKSARGVHATRLNSIRNDTWWTVIWPVYQPFWHDLA